jgi:hypothetical protein
MNTNGARWRCLWCLARFPTWAALVEHRDLCVVKSAIREAELLRGRRLEHREMMAIRDRVRAMSDAGRK